MQCTNDTDRPDMDNKNRGSVRADSSQHWNLMGLSSSEDSSWLQKTVLWSVPYPSKVRYTPTTMGAQTPR